MVEECGLHDEQYMEKALEMADAALDSGELPFGAVMVDSHGDVIGKAHALDRERGNRVSHAEVLLLQENRYSGMQREELTCYTTVEPCVMCTASLLIEGIGRVVYGLPAPEDGSTFLLDDSKTVTRCGGTVPKLTGGVLKQQCRKRFSEYAELPGVPPEMASFAKTML